MHRRYRFRSSSAGVILAGLALASMFAGSASASPLKVAVAANFTDPAKEIASLFEKASGHKLVLSFGSTGQFYAQISQGAPFEVFLSADKATPAKAISEGHAIKGTEFTYAVGRLVLFSKTPGLVENEQSLKQAKFSKLAIANPSAAPYGAAAVETMKALGVWDALQPRIVQGQNIAQTFKFTETANADAGFVALSQVVFLTGGSRWVVPGRYHAPIAQDAVLLKAGSANKAAREFLAFMRSDQARLVIEKFGYGVSE